MSRLSRCQKQFISNKCYQLCDVPAHIYSIELTICRSSCHFQTCRKIAALSGKFTCSIPRTIIQQQSGPSALALESVAGSRKFFISSLGSLIHHLDSVWTCSHLLMEHGKSANSTNPIISFRLVYTCTRVKGHSVELWQRSSCSTVCNWADSPAFSLSLTFLLIKNSTLRSGFFLTTFRDAEFQEAKPQTMLL